MARLDKLTLLEMFNNSIYSGLAEGLIKLPIPNEIKIGKKYYPVPEDMAAFAANICYGQRLFIVRKQNNDYGSILRMIDGYYYPLVTKLLWDEEKALLYGKNVLTCKAIELYPVAMHLITLVSEMVTREQKLLHREPKPLELAAGIDKLSKFAELDSLDFLRDVLKCTTEQVMLTPYNDCLVRFLQAKETSDYLERKFKLEYPEKK
jgi:hypothetical protein